MLAARERRFAPPCHSRAARAALTRTFRPDFLSACCMCAPTNMLSYDSRRPSIALASQGRRGKVSTFDVARVLDGGAVAQRPQRTPAAAGRRRPLLYRLLAPLPLLHFACQPQRCAGKPGTPPPYALRALARSQSASRLRRLSWRSIALASQSRMGQVSTFTLARAESGCATARRPLRTLAASGRRRLVSQPPFLPTLCWL